LQLEPGRRPGSSYERKKRLRTCERGVDDVPRLDISRHESSLHLGDCVVDRNAGSFVEDLYAVDTHGHGRTVFVVAVEGDIERKSLICILRLTNLSQLYISEIHHVRPPLPARPEKRSLWSLSFTTPTRCSMPGISDVPPPPFKPFPSAPVITECQVWSAEVYEGRVL
jgi:hypothetical protein